MQTWLIPYTPSVIALGAMGGLLVLQLLVLDLAGIRSGHKPGMPVEPDQASLLFRAARAHANTNESIGAFVALMLAGIMLGANAQWLNGLCWTFVAARVAHMAFYYAGRSTLRSAAFGLGLLAQLGMCIALVLAALG